MLAGLIGRLIYITRTDGERYAKQVLSRQTYVRGVIPYKRGEILDRNGTVLARNELRYRLILDPYNLLNNSDKIPATLEALKSFYGIEAETVNTILEERPDSRYKILLDNLQLSQVEPFKQHMEENPDIKGLWFEEKYIRAYPYETLAADVIGFTSADGVGLYGIEGYYNEELTGVNGREFGYYDSELNIERIIKEPENGKTIVSTIDINAQRIIQRHIREFNEEFGSFSIGVLVMDPNNGEIIAMASNEEYNLNSPRDLSGIYSEEELAAMTLEEKLEAMNALWKNDVISFGYEPGSTFKPFTVAMALEEGIVSKNSTFFCDGVEHAGGWDIKCSARNGHGTLTLTETLMRSCNDAMMQIAAMEGRDIFYKYQKYFSFGEKTNIDLPGEESGIITDLKNLNAAELATSSFGQTFNVTMLQMAAAFSSLVNGGYYYRPHVVREILNDEKATVKKVEPVLVRRTVSEETSEFIKEAMYKTVEMGTAKPAKVEGYTIGGKTGTAEKFPRGKGKYVVSFLGCAPALDPEIVIYVVINEPQNVARQDDSSIATKFANRIMTELLPALGIYPEGEIDYLIDENLAGEDNTGSNENGMTGNNQDTNGTGATDTEGDEGQSTGTTGTNGSGGQNTGTNGGEGQSTGNSGTNGSGGQSAGTGGNEDQNTGTNGTNDTGGQDSRDTSQNSGDNQQTGQNEPQDENTADTGLPPLPGQEEPEPSDPLITNEGINEPDGDEQGEP